MLRGLKPVTLGTAAIDARSFKGHALVHVARGAAVGNLALTIEHSADGSTGWTDAQAVTFKAGSNLAGAEAYAEIDMDKFKRYIRKKSSSVGDSAVIVAQVDGY